MVYLQVHRYSLNHLINSLAAAILPNCHCPCDAKVLCLRCAALDAAIAAWWCHGRCGPLRTIHPVVVIFCSAEPAVPTGVLLGSTFHDESVSRCRFGPWPKVMTIVPAPMACCEQCNICCLTWGKRTFKVLTCFNCLNFNISVQDVQGHR